MSGEMKSHSLEKIVCTNIRVEVPAYPTQARAQKNNLDAGRTPNLNQKKGKTNIPRG